MYLIGIVLVILGGVSAIILALAKVINAVTKLIISWQDLKKTQKK
ncbi:hypothetical protein ACVQ8P_07860 [Dellaglioa sp. BT-FLS60]